MYVLRVSLSLKPWFISLCHFKQSLSSIKFLCQLAKSAHSFSNMPFIKLGGFAHFLIVVSSNRGSCELKPPISPVVIPVTINGIFVCRIMYEHIMQGSWVVYRIQSDKSCFPKYFVALRMASISAWNVMSLCVFPPSIPSLLPFPGFWETQSHLLSLPLRSFTLR